MLEIARYLEQIAVWFNPVILVVPGLIAVLLGLFIWLGGLGYRKILVAILGAVSGGICGFLVVSQSVIAAAILAIVTAVIALLLERIFITILTGVVVFVIGFAILAGPCIGKEERAIPVNKNKIQNRREAFGISQSAEIAKEYIVDFITEIKQICSQMPIYKWIIVAMLTIAFVAVEFFQQRLTSAFCCAAAGTMLIFAGMILLLLYKGATPISHICQSHLFYLGIFAVMTAFGTTEQLLFCKDVKERFAKKEKIKKNPEKQPDREFIDWRTR